MDRYNVTVGYGRRHSISQQSSGLGWAVRVFGELWKFFENKLFILKSLISVCRENMTQVLNLCNFEQKL